MKHFPESEVVLAISNMADKNMSFRRAAVLEEAVENRRVFLKKHNLSLEDCVVPSLSHGDEILVVDRSDRGKGAIEPQTALEAEALITNDPGTNLFLFVADCFPVAYYDPIKKVIALAHLGWRPAERKLAAKVVEKMKNKFNSNPSDLKVYIGPGIHPESYVYDSPVQTSPVWKPYLTQIPNTTKFSIDLLGLIKDQLFDAGITRENLEVSDIDTAADKSYYSHYRSKVTGEPEGRFAVAVALK